TALRALRPSSTPRPWRASTSGWHMGPHRCRKHSREDYPCSGRRGSEMTREEFEREFNSRTIAYHPEYRADDRPIIISMGNTGHSEPGHALLVALINQLARAHRRLVLVGNLDLPLRCVDHFGFGTLRRATINLARAINPFLDITHARTVPLEDRLISFGIGADADVRLGCDGWLSIIGPRADVRGDRTSILGAALSACLGAAVAFHRL